MMRELTLSAQTGIMNLATVHWLSTHKVDVALRDCLTRFLIFDFSANQFDKKVFAHNLPKSKSTL
jgi:hypothetical protein